MTCALLAHGLCSPLGPADVAAAALRAGLSRAQQIAWAPEVGYGEDAAPAVGHPALVAGEERWPGLARLAWAELPDHDPVDAVLVALPLPDALRFGPDDGHGERLRGLSPLLPGPVEVFALGHAAAAAAIARADAQLAAGTWRRVLVLAVESLLDADSLAWLAAADRLRGPECSHGLSPGEGAAWWLLARSGSPDALAEVGAGHVPGGEARAPLDDAERWWQAARSAGLPSDGRHWVDLTGEPWRERAWGSLLPHLPDVEPVLTPPLWGDLGAAATLANGSAALAGGGSHVLWSLSGDGGAGVIALSPVRAR